MTATTTTRFLIALFALVATTSHAFTTTTTISSRSMSQLKMGMFDFLGDAFSNEKYEDRRASASHILVDTEEEAAVVAKEIEGGTSFAEAAKSYSNCPSANKGGSLGTFEPGTMVAEFDAVVFNEETPVGQVVGPVKTQFGYHLIVVDNKFEIQDKTEGTGAF